MSSPRYRWWGFVRRMIRDYRGLKAAYEDLHSQSLTADTSGMPHGGGSGRTVEAIALQQLPPDDQKAYDAVTKAVELTGLMADGKYRLDLIRYVYWGERQRKVEDVDSVLPISRRTAIRWHGDFVRLVGKCYGFEVGTYEPKICAKMVESN